jgi:hypothetical protein
MVKTKRTKGQTMIYKILHIKLNIEGHESIKKIRMENKIPISEKNTG